MEEHLNEERTFQKSRSWPPSQDLLEMDLARWPEASPRHWALESAGAGGLDESGVTAGAKASVPAAGLPEPVSLRGFLLYLDGLAGGDPRAFQSAGRPPGVRLQCAAVRKSRRQPRPAFPRLMAR